MQEAYNKGAGYGYDRIPYAIDHFKQVKEEPFTDLRITSARLNSSAGVLKQKEFQAKQGAFGPEKTKLYAPEKVERYLKKMGYDFTKDPNKLFEDEIKLANDILVRKRVLKKPIQIAQEYENLQLENLKKIPGVTTADKIPVPEKTQTRDMFKDFSTRTSAMPFLDPKAILTGLGDVARFFGTPSVAAAFAGTTIKENLEKGDSLLDAATDKMVGIDLLYPELAKQTVGRFAQPTGKGILSMLGRVAMNPFGRAARAFTPVGAGITAIGLGKDYYDFIQRDLARKAADPEAYAAEQEEQMGMSA
jgi:hypothetical protein